MPTTTHHSAPILLSPLLLLVLLAPRPAAGSADATGTRATDTRTMETRQLVLFVTSGLSGHLVNGERTVADLAWHLRAEAAAARDDGHYVAIFDAGRALVPYAESRADGGATMAAVLDAMGCSAFAPSPMDLTLGRERIVPFAKRVSFPVLRAFQTGPGSELAELAESARIDAGDLSLEVRSVFDSIFLGDLRAAGLEVESLDPGETARENSGTTSPDLRVLVVHSRGFGSALVDRDLTWSLVREAPGVDLLVDPNLGYDVTLRRETPDGPIFLVGRELDTSEPWTYARIDVELHRPRADPDGRWRPAHLDMAVRSLDRPPTLPEVGPPSPATRAEIEALEGVIAGAFARFRADWGVPLPPPADQMTRQELERFTLGALREAADAEVAMLNRGVLRPVAEEHWTPPITRETVLRLLTLDQNVTVGRLSGAALRELAVESHRRRDVAGRPTSDALHFLGLDYRVAEDGALEEFEVNGRRLRPDDLYSVVTNTFLTSGGDDYPVLAQMESELLRRPADHVEVIDEDDRRAMEARADVVLPRFAEPGRPFADPAERPLWRFGVEKLALDATSVEVVADEFYDDVADSRASASDTTQARLDLRLFADQDWPALRWQNRLRLRYGVVDTGEVEELVDDLRLEVGAVFHRASAWDDRAHPYLSYAYDTELRPNETEAGGAELPRQLEESLALGLDWDLPSWPRLRAGLLYRRQDDVEVAERWGVVAEGWFHLDPAGRRPGLDVEILAERVEDDAAAISRIDLDLRLAFELSRGLLLTPGLDWYVYRDDRLPGNAEYRALKLGLAWAWTGKVQR